MLTKRSISLALALSVTAAQPAWAAFDTFLTVPGIPGGSTQMHYEGAIEVMSLHQTLVPSTKKADGYCRIEVLKWLDVAGPRLWTAAVTDQLFAEVRIDVVQSGEAPSKLYEIRLQNARIENITTAVDTQVTVPSEKITLVGTSMTLSYAGQKGTVTTNLSCK